MFSMRVTNSGRLTSQGNAEGVGLRNLRKRIQLLYADSSSFAIEQSADDTVTADVRLVAASDREL